MIKLIVSDLDGVLASLKEVHYISLNEALETIGKEFIITESEHISTFDGLSTRKKLELLIQYKNFPKDKIEEVFNLKQQLTAKAIQTVLKRDEQLIYTFSKLKQEGYKLFVASNAIRETVESALKKIEIFDFFDKIIANEDVKNVKPHPEIYLKCMVDAGVSPHETLILEDSKHGRNAAISSGAFVCDIDDVSDTNYENINLSIKNASRPIRYPAKNKLNILIPMAGAGKRFWDTGKYNVPKPIIPIGGKPMIQWVVDCLNIDATYTFIVQNQHYEKYNLETILNLIVPGCNIVQTNGLTEGAACTALLAKELIDNDKHLLIVNSDQYLDWDPGDFLYKMASSNVDGGIITFFKENDKKWSYVKTNDEGYVVSVAEKVPISNAASIGIYYFKHGKDFVSAAEDMIKNNDRSNNEFYIAPTYNYLVKENKKIITYDIKECDFYPTGTPEDLNNFIAKKIK